jgi:hypothetical protein
VRASLLPSHFASHHQPAHVAAATVLLQRCMHHQHLGSSGISLPANIVTVGLQQEMVHVIIIMFYA